MTKSISREDIKSKLNNREAMTLVEALPKKYFDEQHLPGAINIPHDEIRQKAAQLLPDKNAFIVVYCANTECQSSRKATAILEQMGYVNAHEYIEGKQDWLEAKLPVESGKSSIAA
jgi:rhodanese-related sulfurtransferase